MTASVFNTLDRERNPYADKFHIVLKSYGVDFATGVPCGVIRHFIQNFSQDTDITHISATRESEAIGIATGAYLTGRKPVVYMQNSGLFNSSNDIASLLIPYRIPLLFLVSWRGAPGEDAPQHFVTGRNTMPLLDSLEIPYRLLDKEKIDEVLSQLFEYMEGQQLPAVVLVRRGWSTLKEEML